MVIFYSYVSLPEGKHGYSEMGKVGKGYDSPREWGGPFEKTQRPPRFEMKYFPGKLALGFSNLA